MIRAEQGIAVLGAGSWGTALAVQLGARGYGVQLWARSSELAERLESGRENPTYLPGVKLPAGVRVTSELEAVVDCGLVLVVVPSHGFRQVLREYLAAHRGKAEPLIVVSGTKGIESETRARMSQVSLEEGDSAGREIRFAVISGPSFAAELAAGHPTAAVVAAADPGLAEQVRDLVSGANFRLYSSTDVVGVEIGGTAKNVIAIAAGAVIGIGFGSNTLAALITRGLHEITRLGLSCGGRQRTFSGLAGLGDLVLTCTGGLSRNRRTGIELAAGRTLEEITGATSMVAEGVRNSLTLVALARERGVEMPIAEQMVEVLYQEKPPRQALEELMRRDLKAEAEL